MADDYRRARLPASSAAIERGGGDRSWAPARHRLFPGTQLRSGAGRRQDRPAAKPQPGDRVVGRRWTVLMPYAPPGPGSMAAVDAGRPTSDQDGPGGRILAGQPSCLRLLEVRGPPAVDGLKALDGRWPVSGSGLGRFSALRRICPLRARAVDLRRRRDYPRHLAGVSPCSCRGRRFGLTLNDFSPCDQTVELALFCHDGQHLLDHRSCSRALVRNGCQAARAPRPRRRALTDSVDGARQPPRHGLPPWKRSLDDISQDFALGCTIDSPTISRR